MNTVQVTNISNQLSHELDANFFDRPFNDALVQQVLVSYRANLRQGSVKQKTRSEVRGGGAKPWKQKGTGRARAGSIRSPIFRGGGVTFARNNRDYSQKVNKKMYRAAMQTIVSQLLREGRLKVFSQPTFSLDSPKTKAAIAKLNELKLENRILIVVTSLSDSINLILACRNLSNVELLEASELNPLSLVVNDCILFEDDVVNQLQKNWQAKAQKFIITEYTAQEAVPQEGGENVE